MKSQFWIVYTILFQFSVLLFGMVGSVLERSWQGNGLCSMADGFAVRLLNSMKLDFRTKNGNNVYYDTLSSGNDRNEKKKKPMLSKVLIYPKLKLPSH